MNVVFYLSPRISVSNVGTILTLKLISYLKGFVYTTQAVINQRTHKQSWHNNGWKLF